jgi:hypothetical protein
MTNGQYGRCRVSTQSAWKKSAASMTAAWECMNCRQVVSVRRLGAGGIRSAFRTRQIVDAPTPVTELEQLTLDPLISPAAVLSREPLDQPCDLGADRRPSHPVRVGPLPGDQAAVPAQDGTGGDQPVRPQPSGQVPDQRGEDARSAQSSRGRGLVRRSTATSCRKASNSALLEADDRPSKTSQPQSRMKMRYSRRRDADDHDAPRLALVIAAAHSPGKLLAPHSHERDDLIDQRETARA